MYPFHEVEKDTDMAKNEECWMEPRYISCTPYYGGHVSWTEIADHCLTHDPFPAHDHPEAA